MGPVEAVDARGRTVRLGCPARRIVSLVPSQTELLADLGLDEEVVGLTRFCVHPQGWKRRKRVVGGTKDPRLERVAELEPDLVLANLEENRREDVEGLETIAPVFVTDVPALDAALAMIRTVGGLVGRAEGARALAERIAERFGALGPFAPLRTAYLIWRAPFMTVGGGTFIDDLLRRGGLENAFGDRRRYPVVGPEDLRAARPALVALPSEPYPFRPRHLEEMRALLPATRVIAVDGERFSWYGSRLLGTPAYLRRLRARVDRA